MDELSKKLISLSQVSKAQLNKILQHIPGNKDLTLDPEIIKPLQRVCGVSWLKQNGIEKIYMLEPTVPVRLNKQLFIIYSNFKTFKSVLDLIQSHVNLDNPPLDKYHIICVPKHLYVFENMLEEVGLYLTAAKIYSWQWFPINLDGAVLSMELPRMYKAIFVEEDYMLLPSYAKCLWYLNLTFGKPKFTLSLGKYANIVVNQMKQYEDDSTESVFGGLVVVDRSMDYPSALLTPRTYSALLKEVYNVQCGECEYKAPEVVAEYDDKLNPVVKKQPVRFYLDSINDTVYKDIKNKYFTEVTTILSALTKQLKSEGESSKGMAIDEMKKYIQTQLQSTRSKKKYVTNHLNAAETIMNVLSNKFENQIDVERNIMQNKNKSNNFTYLEEVLQTENDKYTSLAFMCLMAATQKLSESEAKSFLNIYFLEFGFEHGYIYRNLINTNFIEEFSSGPAANITNLSSKLKNMPLISNKNFYSNASKLKQIPADPDKINLKNPTCCSYVFGGTYIPLITQIASLILCSTPLDEIKSKLSSFGQIEIHQENTFPLRQKSLLMLVVGGVTYSEIAACELLENLIGARIVILSDKIISGCDIADALIRLE